MESEWTVTRQCQWPEGASVVEISGGGLDYTNPDALVQKYPGEFETYTDPREAALVALEICKLWREDGEIEATVGIGATGGMTMPFDEAEDAEVVKWGQETYKKLEKCPTCGEVVEGLKKWFGAGLYCLDGDFIPYDDDVKYCSQRCAEKASSFDEEDEEVEDEENG